MANSILGLNLYIYCNNNPINFLDSNGYFAAAVGTLAIAGGTNIWNPLGWTFIAAAVIAIGVGIYYAVDYFSESSNSTSSNTQSTGNTTPTTPEPSNNKKNNNNKNNKKKKTNTNKNKSTQISGYTYSKTISKYKINITARPYMKSSQLLPQEIMKSSIPVKDKSLLNGLKWVTKGTMNGSEGIYELIVNMDTKTIVHYLFKGGL